MVSDQQARPILQVWQRGRPHNITQTALKRQVNKMDSSNVLTICPPSRQSIISKNPPRYTTRTTPRCSSNDAARNGGTMWYAGTAENVAGTQAYLGLRTRAIAELAWLHTTPGNDSQRRGAGKQGSIGALSRNRNRCALRQQSGCLLARFVGNLR